MTTGLQVGRFHSLFKYTLTRVLGMGTIKSYSVFPKHYIPPVFRKEEQALLEETGELNKMTHIPILPAMKGQTSSEFFDPAVDKFIKYIMREGRKGLARDLLEETFQIIKRKQLRDYHLADPADKPNIILSPKEIFHKAVENCKPVMELKTIKKGGQNYRVPIPILEQRQTFLSMNWLIEAGKDKRGPVKFSKQLAVELLDAANNKGRVVQKKQNLHKQCEANRTYAHFRWS